MKDESKTKAQLIGELNELRRRIGEWDVAADEKQRTIEELHKVQRHFDAAQQLAHLGIWVWDIPTGKVEWTDEVYRIFGLEPKTFDPDIDSVMSRFHPEDQKAHEEVMAQAIAHGDRYDFDVRIVLPDGSVRYIVSTSKGHLDEAGNLLHISGTVQDITERQQMEARLQESEERLRSVVETSPDHLLLLDTDLKIQLANYASPGLTVEELIDTPVYTYVEEEKQAEIKAILEGVVKTGTPTRYETEYYVPDGNVVYYESRVAPQRRSGSDKIIGLTMNARDITEQKQSEEALRENEEKLRLLFDNTHDLICLTDVNAKVLWANAAWKEIFGDDLEKVAAAWEALVQDRRELRNLEYRFRNASGEYLTFESTAHKVMVGEETLIYVVAHDITEHKRTEEELRTSERELNIRNRISEIFLTTPDDQMYADVLHAVLNSLESEYGTFGYFQDDGSFVVPAMTREIDWEKCNVPDKEIIFERGTFSGIWERAIQEQKTLYNNEGPFTIPEGHIAIHNTMVTPIYYRDKLLSAIHIANKSTGYSEKDKELLETIADHIAPVLYARLEWEKEEERRQLLGVQTGEIGVVRVHKGISAFRPLFGVYGDTGGAERIDVPKDRAGGYLQLPRKLGSGNHAPLLEEQHERDQPISPHRKKPVKKIYMP